jgi:lysophospholipid acyltransferase 1/2
MPLADAINNAAGYGFKGMDANGKPSWDLICNLNIWGIEVCGQKPVHVRTPL